MIKIHRILFKIWKAYMWLNGIKEYRTVYTHKINSSEVVSGIITSLSGESVTKTKFGFDINIDWDNPLQGNDSRYYSTGSYKYKDFDSGKISL